MLYVSGGFSTHHQELETIHNMGIFQAFSASFSSLTIAVRSRKSLKNT
jgi:hypothetical protein